MKEYLNLYRNWRIHVLTVLVIVGSVLIMGECEDSMGKFLLSKVAGFSIAYLTYRLGKYWNSKGKIDELMKLSEEE